MVAQNAGLMQSQLTDFATPLPWMRSASLSVKPASGVLSAARISTRAEPPAEPSITCDEMIVKPNCAEPFNAACIGLIPSSMKREIFSIITMASSTTKPVEMVNAINVRLFSE